MNVMFAKYDLLMDLWNAIDRLINHCDLVSGLEMPANLSSIAKQSVQ